LFRLASALLNIKTKNMKIGVYGSAAGAFTDGLKDKAREIGRAIAKKGHTLVTGGCTGLPHEAVLGAMEFKGRCVAFPPVTDMEALKKANQPTEGFAEFIFVPKDYEYADDILVCRKYRNVSTAAYIDAAIIICGRIGTMNEFTNVYDIGKPIGVLTGTGGITKRAIKVLLEDIDKVTGARVIFESDPAKLVELICGGAAG
jgi:hypothetical protein